MPRILFIALLLIFYSPQAFSSIRDIVVKGASRYDYDGENSPIVWAGLGGTDPRTCIPNDSNNPTCNNCLGGSSSDGSGSDGRPQTCNENRIDINGYLTIFFRSDTNAGVPIVTDSSKQAVIGSRIQNAPSVTVNEPTSVEMRWSDICAQVDGASSCEAGGVTIGNSRVPPIFIGIDSDSNGSLNDSGDDSLQVNIEIRSQLPGEGIETFTLFPGDEKVYMLTPDDKVLIPDTPNIEFPNSFPSYDGNLITEIRFYYEEVSGGEDVRTALNRIANNSYYVKTEVTNLDTSGDVELSQLYFTKSDGPEERGTLPFNNDSTYVFKIALVDEAGNIGLFNSNNTFDETKHVVTPSEVIGLLKNNGFCFIVTAAYGKSHKILEPFYQFRDQKLLPYALGRIIHDLYYTYSPPLADIIRDNVFLKYIARISLIPFWIYAFLALQIGHILTFLLLAGSISIPMYFLIKKKVFRVLWLSK